MTRDGIIVTEDDGTQVTAETLDLEYPLVQFYHRFQDFIDRFRLSTLTVEAEYDHYLIQAT